MNMNLKFGFLETHKVKVVFLMVALCHKTGLGLHGVLDYQ